MQNGDNETNVASLHASPHHGATPHHTPPHFAAHRCTTPHYASLHDTTTNQEELKWPALQLLT